MQFASLCGDESNDINYVAYVVDQIQNGLNSNSGSSTFQCLTTSSANNQIHNQALIPFNSNQIRCNNSNTRDYLIKQEYAGDKLRLISMTNNNDKLHTGLFDCTDCANLKSDQEKCCCPNILIDKRVNKSDSIVFSDATHVHKCEKQIDIKSAWGCMYKNRTKNTSLDISGVCILSINAIIMSKI